MNHLCVSKIGNFAGLFLLTTFISLGLHADIVEDFNDDQLIEGLYVMSWDGSLTPNTDNATWRLTTIEDQWRYAAIVSPSFTGDAITAKSAYQNFTNSFDAWEAVTVYLKGHNFEVSFVFGLNEEYTFYIDSSYSIEGEAAPATDSIVLPDLNEYPNSLELEIEYNGPGEPIHFYYTLDNGARMQASTLSVTASSTSAGDFDYTVRFGCGEIGPFGADINSIEIIGGDPVSLSGNAVHRMALEVSTVQGQDHWYYRVGDPLGGEAIRELIWSDTAYGNWEEPYWYDQTGDPDQTNWADIIDIDTLGGPWRSVHNDTSPRLEWESPYNDNSSAVITGTFKFESDWDQALGLILLNGEPIWESIPLTIDGEVEGFQIEIPTLNQGDIISFTADGTQWLWMQYVHTAIQVFYDGETSVMEWPVQ